MAEKPYRQTYVPINNPVDVESLQQQDLETVLATNSTMTKVDKMSAVIAELIRDIAEYLEQDHA
jgi:hypothetical protein